MKHSFPAWVALCVLIGCAKAATDQDVDPPPREEATETAPVLPAAITIDGSSTVYPVAQAVVAEFNSKHRANVQVAFSGTGGGFRKFCKGELTINGASRPITAAEAEACRSAGVRYVELPIALDGIVVAVHPDNDWAKSITVSELKLLWEPRAQQKVLRWSQVRKGWPDQEIRLYGAGTDSGTYDYFTKAIVGAEHSSRTDFKGSEDDDALVDSIAKDPLSLGFFGIAYYEKNGARIAAVAVDDEKESNGSGAVLPSIESVSSGTYQPLSRPIFIYVNRSAADRPEISELVRFFVRTAKSSVNEVGYVALPDRSYQLVLSRFEHRVPGSLFHGRGSTIGVKASDLTAGK